MTLPFFGLQLAGGVESTNLVSDLGLAASYYSSDVSPASAHVALNIKTDGTWSIAVGSGDSLTGSPTSGTWLTAGSASDYEVQFVLASEFGSPPNSTNDAPTYTAITADRSILFEAVSGNDVGANVTVNLRKIGTTSPVLSDTAAFEADSVV